MQTWWVAEPGRSKDELLQARCCAIHNLAFGWLVKVKYIRRAARLVIGVRGTLDRGALRCGVLRRRPRSGRPTARENGDDDEKNTRKLARKAKVRGRQAGGPLCARHRLRTLYTHTHTHILQYEVLVRAGGSAPRSV